MEDDTVLLTVCVMPPAQPANSLQPVKPKQDEPVAQWSQAFRKDLPVAKVWGKIEEFFKSGYSEEKRAGAYFSRLRNSNGRSDVFCVGTIGEHYRMSMSTQERTIYMLQNAVDRDCSIPVGSALRPPEFRKRTASDLSPAERETVKRRRFQEARFGATVDELDADTPVTSREPGAEGASNDGVAQEEEQPRVDNQGFKIPTKIMKPQTRRAPQTESHVSQATVLVEDSQAQIPAKKPQSSSAMLQQKLKFNSVRPRSVPANHSSPTEAAAARATTVAPRPQAARGSRQKNTATPQAAEVAQKAGHSRETLPTPVSGKQPAIEQ